MRYLFLLCIVLELGTVALGQATLGSIHGQITDETGAVIPNVKVTAVSGGTTRTVTSDYDGSYTIPGLPSGTYTVTATAPGLGQFQNTTVTVNPGQAATLNIAMRVQIENQEVTVQDTAATNQISTDPTSNAGALVLRGEDLAALPDDPDDLAEDLQALAGPSAGPNGAQMFIDGFTGGRLPPKESIREIRINQNPFSAEYDRLGYGRIEIFTKPGTDKFHGQAFYNFTDRVLDARNPFSQNAPPYRNQQFGGNVSGPLSKKSSFFLDFERRATDENAVVNARTLDLGALVPETFAQAVVTPLTRTTFSPRFDYALTPNVTLTGRYTWSRNSAENQGIGEYSLPTTAFNRNSTQHTLQLTETAILGTKAVNETRFQFIRENTNQVGLNNQPQIDVLESFVGGGSTIGLGFDRERRYEFQNYTSITSGQHVWRFGARVRAVQVDTQSLQNFNGTFIFAGGYAAPELGPDNQPTGNILPSITSLEAYRRTVLFQGLGYTPEQIRGLGGGASQFMINGGQPLAGVDQVDLGLFVQDDWRVKPNFTLSLGLRYETQTNIHDWTDFAPRLGFAWAPGASNSSRPKMVIRGGSGVFYSRFDESLTLTALRYNGVNQQQFVISRPDFFPNVPDIATLQAQQRPQTIRQVYSGLRAPYIIQSAIGVERQLPLNSTVAVTFTNSHGLHTLVSRNINAPLPGTNVRPYPSLGMLNLYESSGIFNQNQMIVNVNSRMSRNFTLFTGYVLNYARSNTDGAGMLPSNQYDLAAEYGRSSMDIRHRFFLGGSVTTRWNIRLAPFITAHSGAPFNIYTGRDLNGDLVINDRPAFATADQMGQPGIVATPWGVFNVNPGPNDRVIPRNYGQGPRFFTVNLRLSKTFGFGGSREPGGVTDGGFGGGGRGGRGGRGGPGGGMRMGGGMRGLFGDGSTGKRYNLTLSISARNLLNSTNYGQYSGNLASPYFGQANGLASGFGPDRGAAATNRRVDLMLRLTF